MNSEDSIVIFTHIPKTAGQSVAGLISKHLRGKSAGWGYDVHKGNHREAVTFAYGHYAYGYHKYYLNLFREFRYVTMLREPVRRVISNLNFINKQRRGKEYDLISFCNTFGGDLMTKYLSGYELNFLQYYGSHGALTKALVDGDPWLKDNGYFYADEGLLHLAKRNLELFYTFGLQDRFFETMEIFADAGLARPGDHMHRNGGNYDRNLDGYPVEYALEFNKMDAELYRFAEELFNKRLSEVHNG
jgi:hypothetical protein